MKIFASFCLLCSILCIRLYAQDMRLITLRNDRVKLQLKGFYIDKVLDSLPEADKIGLLKKGTDIRAEIRTATNLEAATLRYLANNTTHPEGASPITLVVKELEIIVKQSARGYTATAKARFGFYAGKNMIATLGSNGKIESPTFPSDQIESFVRKAYKTSLQQFDKWWLLHQDEVPGDTTAKVIVVMGTSTDKPERIVYMADRPLTYNDFTGDYTEHKGEEAAITASGIGYEYKSGVEHGRMTVHVKLTPVFYKKDSWFRPDGKNEKVLAHEQTHFDITAIKTCEMIAAIKVATFSLENYDKELQFFLEDFTRLTKDEEDRYDAETNHGLNRDKQLEWETKIKARIKEVGCF